MLRKKIWNESRLILGKTMSSAPTISGNQIVPEGRKEHRHCDPEDHQSAVVGHQGVVLARRDHPEARHVDAGEGELHAKDVGHESADQRHEHASEHVTAWR